MKRKFRIKFVRDGQSAAYTVEFPETGNGDQVKATGDTEAFTHGDGTPISFAAVPMDELAQTAKSLGEECGADYIFEDLTGKREFQIKLEGGDFRVEYIVNYTEGNPIPLVTTPASEHLAPLPNGMNIPFDKVPAADLQGFVASMAKSNGLNFEFVDLHD